MEERAGQGKVHVVSDSVKLKKKCPGKDFDFVSL
jgi:hypothetical protein